MLRVVRGKGRRSGVGHTGCIFVYKEGIMIRSRHCTDSTENAQA